MTFVIVAFVCRFRFSVGLTNTCILMVTWFQLFVNDRQIVCPVSAPSEPLTKKVQERRLEWYGHVMRREEHNVGRRAIEMKVQGRRKRGRPKRRWLDKVKDHDIKEKGLSADDVYDRATWRRMSSYIDPT